MRTQTTLERWQQVHGLLDRGRRPAQCARRLQLSLNTVKRYARAAHPGAPRGHPIAAPAWSIPSRTTCAAAVPWTQACRSCACSRRSGNSATRQSEPALSLHHSGRVETDLSPVSPKQLTRLLLTRPATSATSSANFWTNSPPPSLR